MINIHPATTTLESSLYEVYQYKDIWRRQGVRVSILHPTLPNTKSQYNKIISLNPLFSQLGKSH